MAIFSKNANRAALFGKQKLFKACCTPEVEECCYLTNPVPVPRPPAPSCQACGRDITYSYLVNNNPIFALPITIDTTELPAVIEVFFRNNNRECDATFGKVTSDTPNSNINIITYSPNPLESGENVLVATIQLNTVLGVGSYTPYINYPLCGESYALGIDIQIDAV